MTASNMWALILGGLAAGGALTGAIVWQHDHTDLPSMRDIAKLVTPATNPPPMPSTDRAEKTATASPSTNVASGLLKGPPPKAEPPSGHGEPPHFDVVRVEPSGDAVVAGKGDPNAKVALLSAGKVVAETKADANGQFVIMPPALRAGDHDLSLRQTSKGKPDSESRQNVAISVPPRPNGDVIVALAEPGKPTKILSGPPGQKDKPSPTAARPAEHPQVAMTEPATKVTPPVSLEADGSNLAIRSVELENGSGLFASGVAAAGQHVQIYLNGSHLAEVVAGRDNQWSLTVKRGLSAGHYTVRADASRDGRTVTSRVEVPFDVPEAMVAKSAEPPPPDLGKPKEASASLASQMPHEAPVRPATSPSTAAPAAAPAAVAAAPAATRPDASKTAGATSVPAARPSVVAEAPPRPASAPQATAAARPTIAPSAPDPQTANAVIEAVETATVSRGDNLWNISRARLGEGYRYTRIYAANSDQIRDPKLIYPGQVFVMPRASATN